MRSASDGAQQAVAHRQQRGLQGRALADGAQQLADAEHLHRLGRGVDRTAVGEDSLEADQSAGAQQAQRFSEVVEGLGRVPVAEDEVVPAVGEPR